MIKANNKMEMYKQAIELPNEVDKEIFNLPCVSGIWKDKYGGLKYELNLSSTEYGKDIIEAESGDILVQLANGSWTIMDEEELEKNFG